MHAINLKTDLKFIIIPNYAYMLHNYIKINNIILQYI